MGYNNAASSIEKARFCTNCVVEKLLNNSGSGTGIVTGAGNKIFKK
jgi:hypothetical protein